MVFLEQKDLLVFLESLDLKEMWAILVKRARKVVPVLLELLGTLVMMEIKDPQDPLDLQ